VIVQGVTTEVQWRFPPLAWCNSAVLDDSANALFMTEIVRGMAYTIKAYFDPKVTVSSRLGSSTLSAQ
jgi:hypothetical protein